MVKLCFQKTLIRTLNNVNVELENISKKDKALKSFANKVTYSKILGESVLILTLPNY